MEEDYYIQLLEQQLSGSISRADRKVLTAWRKAAPANERAAKSIELAWRMTAPKAEVTAGADLDAAFAGLEARIAADEAAPVAGARRVRLQARPGRLRLWLAAAAAVLLLVAAGTFLLREELLGGSMDSNYISEGTQSNSRLLHLADGSQVRLNDHSKLYFTEAFEGAERRVILEGEAFFDVARNEDQPFVVETAQGEVRVLGTSFNVNARAEAPTTEVFVASGRVQVAAQGGASQVIIAKNEGATIEHASQTVSQRANASPNAMSWHSGRLVFEETKLSVAIMQIEKQFAIRFRIKEAALLDCSVDAVFEVSNVERFISDLQTIFGASVERVSLEEFVIVGGEC